MILHAKLELEQVNHLCVVAAYLAPSSQDYVNSKLGADAIPLSKRIAMCKLAVADDDRYTFIRIFKRDGPPAPRLPSLCSNTV